MITAKQARDSAPINHPEWDKETFKKIMLYTFHIISQRAKAGYNYAEFGLTQIPRLEFRRAKVLKRLGYNIKEIELQLVVSWEK